MKVVAQYTGTKGLWNSNLSITVSSNPYGTKRGI